MSEAEWTEERILVLAPLGRDAALIGKLLSGAEMDCALCSGAGDLQSKLEGGAAAVVLTHEALAPGTLEILTEAVKQQPTWSDLPIVLLVTNGWRRSEEVLAFGRRHNVTVLERPTRSATLMTVLRAALRARQRQYQVRDLLARLEIINTLLEYRVEERTQELSASNQKLREEIDARIFASAKMRAAHAETELERQRATTILESISEAFVAVDDKYRITYLNRHAAELLKQFPAHSDGDLRGTLLWDLIQGMERSPFGDAYRGVMATQTATELEEFFAPLGTWFEVHIYPLDDGIALYFRDITARKRSEEELLEAVQAVMSDAAWFSQSLMEKLAQVRSKGPDGTVNRAEVAELTPREREVMELLAKGRNNKQIAAELKLAEQTVRNYISNVYEKLNLHSRTEAVVWARERGLAGR